ncbi:hypothetical protein MCOR16_009094 [Pyricularia oryzae]|nr:hypothetical protein MCOR15_004253 [Pyricularia oryzae]KAI6518243.1 hypothetical protein MCOR16_009094 [Pyricularia oryzae]
MGNQMAGTSVWHVYARILAGLYYGQLGRVIESYWHIHDACIKTQHLLRGDIIAELNLQQSGISKYEQRIPTPNLQHMIECGIDKRVAYSYYAQLWLRKTLNKAHTALYGPKSERERCTLISLVKILHSNLTESESLWWPKFHDHDPQTPADNILDARLRAKYWGAMNITCRPVIKSILMRDYQMQEGLDMTDPLNELLDPKNQTVLEIAERGINALVIMSSHPAAVTATAKAFGYHLRLIKEDGDAIMKPSPVAYIKEATLCGSLVNADDQSGLVLGVNTSFYVDHTEPLEALKTVREDWAWPFGDLPDGHEYLLILEGRGLRSRSRSSSRDPPGVLGGL